MKVTTNAVSKKQYGEITGHGADYTLEKWRDMHDTRIL